MTPVLFKSKVRPRALCHATSHHVTPCHAGKQVAHWLGNGTICSLSRKGNARSVSLPLAYRYRVAQEHQQQRNELARRSKRGRFRLVHQTARHAAGE